MLTYSVHIYHFHSLTIYQFSRKNLSLAQFILGIYNKIIIKILGYFWGVTVLMSKLSLVIGSTRLDIVDPDRLAHVILLDWV